ncbi:hypothetical protein QE152_g4636 [Popillia japonica]|uniref:INO80 complex subunit B-like conserved region domain-containing protein n=1 Tax=Popillia japonica TaxID=7064 RepID=A0AAW1MV00_POPJA
MIPYPSPQNKQNNNQLNHLQSLTPKSKQQPTKPSTSNSNNNKKRKKRDSASSDEERWLTAIESGKLEDVDDELKKIKPKDPALMTARQRAMYDRAGDGSPGSAPMLMSLPTGYKEKVMTAEAIQKAAIKSQKRKQLADEKREKDKKKTMERLLKKQETKLAKTTKVKFSKNNFPVILYRQSAEGTFIKFPCTMEYPLQSDKVVVPPKPVYYCYYTSNKTVFVIRNQDLTSGFIGEFWKGRKED